MGDSACKQVVAVQLCHHVLRILCLSCGSCALQAKADTSKQSAYSAAAAPISLKSSASIATPAAAHKHAPSEAYELEDLDEDWVAMLNVLDNRLLEVKIDLLACCCMADLPWDKPLESLHVC